MAILAECPDCHRKQSNKNRQCAKCGADLAKAKRSQRVRYWITYRAGGKQRREAVGFKLDEARAAEGKRKAQKRETPHVLEQARADKMTLHDLAAWYLALARVKALPSFWRIKINLESVCAELGEIKLNDLKPVDLENYQAIRKESGLSDAYIDQELGVARTAVNKAFANDLIDGQAVKAFKRTRKLLRGQANARDRILSPDEFARLMAQLPAHAKPIIATAYYTGMRRGEILGLTWGRVDLEGNVIRLEAGDTKDREAREIPLCDELAAIMSKVPRGLHSRHVFLFKGKPVADIRTTLRKACARAGIPYGRNLEKGFVFHDLRHTFNTNMRKAGVPESVIMKITGHSTREMFDRYNTVDATDKKIALEKMSSFLENVDQTVDQAPVDKK